MNRGGSVYVKVPPSPLGTTRPRLRHLDACYPPVDWPSKIGRSGRFFEEGASVQVCGRVMRRMLPRKPSASGEGFRRLRMAGIYLLGRGRVLKRVLVTALGVRQRGIGRRVPRAARNVLRMVIFHQGAAGVLTTALR